MTTPKCPACGAKFSHDSSKLCCKSCGIPDEIIGMGPQVIARWKRKMQGKRRIKHRHPVRARKAHGRQ